MNKEYIDKLLRLYFTDQASHRERETLFEELQKDYNESDWEELFVRLLSETKPDEDYNPNDWQQKINEIVHPQTIIVPLRPRTTWYRIAAAAVIIGLLIGSYFLFFEKNEKPSIANQPTPVQKDIPPGVQGAILTLSNGKQIVLDSTKGNIASEGGVDVINKDGSVSYGQSETQNPTSEIVYNTVSTPRARQYQLTLQDGTKVWLNAESSIRFPTAFAGKDRVVEITGEAYFEVAHNAAKPFIVSVNDMQVEVLGTHFNINSYSDESAMKTTLLEGKVRVTSAAGITVLKPGQQAQLRTTNLELRTVDDIDVDAVVAWKNGLFSFTNSDLKTIMRQAARWYDVDVTYEGNVPTVQFTGEIGRKLTLKQFLNILEETRIHYKIEGQKLIITP